MAKIKMNYFNIKQDNNKRWVGVLLPILMLMVSTNLFAQNKGENCITIPFSSDSLIEIRKSDARETTVGTIGVRRVQAIALNPTADTIYAARPGRMGFVTFDNLTFTALPQTYGTGNGSLGSVDFIEVEGLTFDRTTNTLFGSVKVEEPENDVLIKINPKTGAHIPDAFGAGVDYVTISGPGVFSIVEDIAASPVDGKMYGLAREELGNDILIEIDKQNGAATVVGAAGINLLEGLGFDIEGNLFATPGFNTSLPPRFFEMNLSTGEAVTIGLLSSIDYESCDCLSQDTSTVSGGPIAQDDFYETDINQELQVDAPGVLENDTSGNGSDLTIIQYDSTTTAGGTVVLNPDGSFTFTPDTDFEGNDSFTYVVSDGNNEIDSATVLITVGQIINGAPVANDDVYSTDQNQELIIDAPGVLANDTDPDGDTLSVVGFDASETDGTVVVNPDGSFTYSPAQDSVGVDTFSYVVSDGQGNTDSASVTITVNQSVPQNNPPVAVDDNYTLDQDSEFMIEDPAEGILANDSDPDGDEIAAQEVNDAITGEGGRIIINGDGTLTYVPRLGFVGTDSYEYTVCDDGNPVLCDTASIYFEVEELPVEVFNAFSPNGDGVNDTWIIQGITRFPNNEVLIYNRWGNLVFEVQGYDNTTKVWKGNATEGVVLGSSESPDGAYFYVIILGDGSERITGYVVVRR